MKCMATSAYQVLDYLMSRPSTAGEIHLLGLILDPLQKDKIGQLYGATTNQVN